MPLRPLAAEPEPDSAALPVCLAARGLTMDGPRAVASFAVCLISPQCDEEEGQDGKSLRARARGNLGRGGPATVQ